MSRFFLIGFMGCGKSTIGHAFAKLHDLPFIDLDELIEKQEGRTIADIFSKEGEEYFRNVERNYLRSVLQQDPVVIATGGGTPCYFDNMHWMNHHGLTVYIQMSAAALEQRLKNELWHRPVLKDVNAGQLLAFISQKLKDREKFYHQANYVLNADRRSVPEAASELAGLFFHL